MKLPKIGQLISATLAVLIFVLSFHILTFAENNNEALDTPIGKVYFIAENNTFSDSEINGVFLSGWYDFYQQDSMMTVILRALQEAGFHWIGQGGQNGNENDFTIQYLAAVIKDGVWLGEFDGGQFSGWMGTLNDWFVSESFSAFSLGDGDVINLVYTCDYGADCGGTWNSADTSIKSLTVEGGMLSAEFDPSVTEYQLTITGNAGNLKLTPSAENKNYLVKIFLNEKITSNEEGESFYKRTQAIPVTSGDIIYIGVGENAWPSMNKTGSESIEYSPTWYKFEIVQEQCQSAEIVDVIFSADNKMILQADICLGELDSAYIIAAAYGENGRMFRSWISHVTESDVKNVNFNIEDTFKWKLTLWNDTSMMTPLCEAWVSLP